MTFSLVIKLGRPPYYLKLIMLLRDLEPNVRLCNDTRLIRLDFMHNLIYSGVLNAQFKGTKILITRISMKPTQDIHLPFSDNL